MKGRCLILSVLFVFVSCTPYYLLKRSETEPGRVAVNILLTNPTQMVLVDSLAPILNRRIKDFADERKDYVLINSLDSADFILKIIIKKLSFSDTAHYKEVAQTFENNGAKVGTVFAANVVANAIALPLGFFVIMAPRESGDNLESEQAKRAIGFSTVTLETSIFITSTKKNMWIEQRQVVLPITEKREFREDKRLLIRQVLFFLEENCPMFYTERKNSWMY